jgi:hypothetical protein
MFSTNRIGAGAFLVMAAGAVLMSAHAARADGPDVRISFSIGNGSVAPLCRPVVVRPEPLCDYAGTLTIDGRRFRIDTSCPVREQVRAAFERMGYDAWCVGRSVRVLKDCDGPEVCWQTGEYSVAFRERRSTITITPFEDDCHDHYGRHDRFAFELRDGVRHYQSYREVAVVGAAGNSGSSWRSMGAATFVQSDRDLDDEVGRGDGRATERVGVQERPRTNDRVDGRSSVPANRDVVRRSPENARVTLPIERKREVGSKPADIVKAMPSDRVVNSKPGVKPAEKPVEKGESKDDGSSRKRDAREDMKKRW